MTLDARGTGVTLTPDMWQLPREVNDPDFASVGLYRGSDAVNTSACLFGSTLALHSTKMPASKNFDARFAVRTKAGSKVWR
jgi:hypothetical protein